MANRLELQAIFKTITPNVYFQPPATTLMKYPCIVYKRDRAQTLYADDSPYRFTKRYQLTVIDRDPDSEIVDKIAKLPMCAHERFFTTDLLNHDVFNIFF